MSGLGAEPHAASRVVAFAGLATSRRGGFSSRVLALTTRVRVATWLRVLPPLCERNEQYDLRLRRHVNVECGVGCQVDCHAGRHVHHHQTLELSSEVTTELQQRHSITSL